MKLKFYVIVVIMLEPSSYCVVRKRKQRNKKHTDLASHQSGMEPCTCRVRVIAQCAVFVSRNYGSSGSMTDVLDMAHRSV